MKVHYRIQNSKQFAAILSHINPIHAFPTCVLRPILILSSHLSSSLPRCLFFFRPLHQTCMDFTSSPVVPCPTNLLWCNFYPYLPHLSPSMDGNWCKRSAHDAVKQSWNFMKTGKGNYEHKWNYIMCVPWQYKKCTSTVCVCVCVCVMYHRVYNFQSCFLCLSL